MRTTNKGSPKKRIIAGIVLLVLAAVCALSGLAGDNSEEISAYPTTQAEIVKCQPIYRDDDDGEYISSYLVDFEYAVDGKTYTRKDYTSLNKMEGSITVYYNPDKPSQAYTETEALVGETAYLYVIAGIFGIAGVVVTVGGVLKKRKLKAE